MTNEKAIEALRLMNLKSVHPFYSWEETKEVRDTAIEALWSRIQKKPIFGENVDSWFCPKCEHELKIYKQNACDECGQLLKWSDAE